MSQYTREQLAEILAEHRKWRLGDGGKRADFRGADLSGADLIGADLYCADLSGADLSGADLMRADLRDANLSGADLIGADLSGADLRGEKILTLVARATRLDGYEFIAFATDAEIVIRAGCRTFSLAEYRKHVAAEYPDTDKAIETLDILDFIELRASRAAHREGEEGVI